MKFSFEEKDFIETELDPDKLAVIGEETELDWKSFRNEVNRFCDWFRREGFDRLNTPVLLYGHKEAEFIVAVYALMRMKIAYIPADVVYPKSRLESIASIARVDLIVNCSAQDLDIEHTAEVSFRKLELSIRKNKTIGYDFKETADPLIYIIFTSGSTGEPKGVQISTEAVRSFTKWMCADFGYTKEDVFINIALFSFDLSVYELMTFGALGASLLLSSKTTSENPDVFIERVRKYRGTVWVSTPSFSFIYSRLGQSELLSSVRCFLFCGELLPHSLAKALKANFPWTQVYNTYGPTEATVATTLIEITEEILEKHNPLPVGYSKPESDLLIEDDEIVIVGENVSLGYLNRPDLNAAKFVSRNGRRAFKTGDKGYLENGNLFFKGRSDDQVKLHGYRIELNEITTRIQDLNFVLQAETIPLKRNEEVKKIVSLVEFKPGLENTAEKLEELKTYLNQKLPAYMVPADIKVVSKIPLNNNGKADKKLLLELYLDA